MIRTRQAADGTIRYLVRIGQSPARTFLRKADAEEYEAELVRSRRRSRAGLETAKPAITYSRLVQLWRDNYSPSKWRLDMVAYSENRWGKVYLADIQPEAVGSWLANLQGKNKPLSEKTKAHVLETMRQVLNAGVTSGVTSPSHQLAPEPSRLPPRTAAADRSSPLSPGTRLSGSQQPAPR